MKITILGCGTSTGVPVIGCSCKVCKSSNPLNNRLRSSVYLETDGNEKILVDTTPDLRQQALKFGLNTLDAVLFTHDHADHLHGLDDLRAYGFMRKDPVPCFGPPETMQQITERFPYIFSDAPHIGGGIPQITLTAVNEKQSFKISPKSPTEITPLHCEHGNSRVYGYKIGTFAYITDTSRIPQETLDKMMDLDLLVLDCLRITPPHRTHLTLDKSLEIVEAVKPKHTVMTHMTHEVNYEDFKLTLSESSKLKIEPAYDGMVLTTNIRRAK